MPAVYWFTDQDEVEAEKSSEQLHPAATGEVKWKPKKKWLLGTLNQPDVIESFPLKSNANKGPKKKWFSNSISYCFVTLREKHMSCLDHGLAE